jgi:phasin family protein
MTDTNDNPVAGYIEAQMAGTAGIVQAAMQGMQRVQSIMLRAMREGAGEQLALARSMAEARDPADLTRVGGAHTGPAAEQFTRYQQELIGAVTDMNTEVIQASYSMMERVSQALAASAAAMGMPAGGQGGPMAAFEAGVRQWQGAVERMTQAAGAYATEGAEADDAAGGGSSRSARKAPARRSGRR